jgi:hypothetical protein
MQKLGPTGKYPLGKLNAEDDGELRIAMGIENGAIKVIFGVYVDWLGFDAKTAREFAAALIEKADEIEGKAN